MLESPDLVSTAQAARMLGVTARTIQRYVADGALTPAYRGDGRTGALVFWRDTVQSAQRARERKPKTAA